MSEKIYSIENVEPLDLFGVNDKNLEIIRASFPKLKIISRGDEIKVIGDKDLFGSFEESLNLIVQHIHHFGKINNKELKDLLTSEADEPKELKSETGVILYGREGKKIRARTINQKKMVAECEKNDLLFAIGPAGTGKTYTAVALAVKALKEKTVKRIILTRPAVEAGESLGFLPGDLRDKLDPYLQPLYDALRDMVPQQKLLKYFEDGTIEIAPLAFMRGRTLNNVFAILDEAQNTTDSQLKMFLTRMGIGSKFIVTGDITQVDLPQHQKPGLLKAEKILNNIKGITFIYLNKKDIIRHQLVTDIVDAYSKTK